MKKNKSNKRYPRPLGSTMAIKEYLTEPNKEKRNNLLTKIHRIYMDDWINKGGYNQATNTLMPLTELSEQLDITEDELMGILVRRLGKFHDLFDNTQKALVNKIASGAIFNGLFLNLESRAIAMSQAQLLIGAQKGKYVPFLSKEANGAISNLINANKGIVDVAKLLSDLASKGMASDMGSGDPTAYLTPTEAVKLLGEGLTTIIQEPKMIEAKRASLGSLPDINPMTQSANLPPLKDIMENKDSRLPEQRKGYVGPDEVIEADDFMG